MPLCERRREGIFVGNPLPTREVLRVIKFRNARSEIPHATRISRKRVPDFEAGDGIDKRYGCADVRENHPPLKAKFNVPGVKPSVRLSGARGKREHIADDGSHGRIKGKQRFCDLATRVVKKMV